MHQNLFLIAQVAALAAAAIGEAHRIAAAREARMKEKAIFMLWAFGFMSRNEFRNMRVIHNEAKKQRPALLDLALLFLLSIAFAAGVIGTAAAWCGQ